MSLSPPLWPRVTRKLKRIAYYPLDAYDLAIGNRPPDELIFVGDGSWRAVGREFLRYFKTLGLLKPDDHVLDVGSGIGRMAAALTRYISDRGSYTGFDIVESGVAWCQKNISTRHPNFTFFHSNVLNNHYNPSGTIPASEYVFPFADGAFDFVFLTSVFTHMESPEVEHYLSEIARVMKPGARCFITFFLINRESEEAMNAGRSGFLFKGLSTACYTADPLDPESAVAFDEEYVRGIFEARALTVIPPVYYGSWSGRRDHVSFQDIVIGVKSDRPSGAREPSGPGHPLLP